MHTNTWVYIATSQTKMARIWYVFTCISVLLKHLWKIPGSAHWQRSESSDQSRLRPQWLTNLPAKSWLNVTDNPPSRPVASPWLVVKNQGHWPNAQSKKMRQGALTRLALESGLSCELRDQPLLPDCPILVASHSSWDLRSGLNPGSRAWVVGSD